MRRSPTPRNSRLTTSPRGMSCCPTAVSYRIPKGPTSAILSLCPTWWARCSAWTPSRTLSMRWAIIPIRRTSRLFLKCCSPPSAWSSILTTPSVTTSTSGSPVFSTWRRWVSQTSSALSPCPNLTRKPSSMRCKSGWNSSSTPRTAWTARPSRSISSTATSMSTSAGWADPASA